MVVKPSQSKVKSWAKKAGIVGVPLIFLIFLYLSAVGNITILTHSENMKCYGTIDSPCVAEIILKANQDINIPVINKKNAIWMFGTTPAIKEILVYKDDVLLDLSKITRLKKDGIYNFTFIGYKNNPQDVIKWSFGKIDPYWFGDQEIVYKNFSLSLVDGEEIHYLGKKYRNVSGCIVSSNEQFKGSWYPESNPKKDLKQMTIEFIIEGKNNYSLKGIGDIPKYYSGHFDINLSSAELLVFKNLLHTFNWSYAKDYDLIESEYINFENETYKEIIQYKEKAFKNYKALTPIVLTTIKTTIGKDIFLDPDISACGVLTVAGVYNVITPVTNTATCMNITGSHIQMDCGGNTNYIRYGTAGVGYGVIVNSSTNVTISNCNISTNSSTGASKYGVYYSLAHTNARILNNTITTLGATSVGIYLGTSGSNAVIDNNWINATGLGVYAYAQTLTNITNNIIRFRGLGGLSPNTGSMRAVNNTIITTGTGSDWGMYLQAGGPWNIINNTIVVGPLAGSNVGIYATGSNYNFVGNNITAGGVTDAAIGIYLASTSNIGNITNNYISTKGSGGTNYGIYMNPATKMNVTGNVIYTNGTINNRGIFIQSASINNIFNFNNITTYSNLSDGFNIWGSLHNRFSNNIINTIHPTSYDWKSLYQAGQLLPQNNTLTNCLFSGNVTISLEDWNGTSVKGLSTSSYADPTGYTNISKYLNITNNSATSWINLGINYNNSIEGINEDSLDLWKYNSTNVWQQNDWNGTFILNTTTKVIWKNVTNFIDSGAGRIYGVFGTTTVVGGACNLTDVAISVWAYTGGKFIDGFNEETCALTPINYSFGQTIWSYVNGKFIDGIGSVTNTLAYDLVADNCNLTDVAISMWCWNGTREINGVDSSPHPYTPINATIGRYVWEWITTNRYVGGVSS